MYSVLHFFTFTKRYEHMILAKQLNKIGPQHVHLSLRCNRLYRRNSLLINQETSGSITFGRHVPDRLKVAYSES